MNDNKGVDEVNTIFKKVRKQKNINKGFTLAEMILAVSLGLIILTLGIQLISLSSRGSVFATKEKELQDANRIFLERTNNSIKYATAVFTVPTKTFNATDNSKLSKDWNYIGIKKDVVIPGRLTSSGKEHKAQTALVNLKYVGSGAVAPSVSLGEDQTLITAIKSGGEKLYYVQTIIAFSEEVNGTEFIYDVVFSKTDSSKFLSSKEGKGLDYKLNVKAMNGTGTAKTEVDYGTVLSKITALNSLQVVDKGTPENPAVALAYRTDNIVKNKGGVYGVVSMVVDTSGSMAWNIEGNLKKNVPIDQQRIGILKVHAKKLLDKFSETKNTDVMVVPFATTTKKKGGQFPKFYSASTDKTTLDNEIQSLNADGGTNTGDGLRYAFYKMGEHNQTITRNYKDYLIILVDGASSSSLITNPVIVNGSHVQSFNFLDNNKFYHDFYDSNLKIDGTYIMQTYNAGQTRLLPPPSSSYYKGIPCDQHGEHGKNYVTHIAKNLYDNPYAKISNRDSAAAIDRMIKEGNVFLIGFSKDVVNDPALKKIAEDFHIDTKAQGDQKRYFEATSAVDLSNALAGIGAAITKDLWMINGPEL
ncbi:VWA domain-containing protein [Filifactor alocis]|uniref:VWA domain-containing protein n=1 Tax=Filifactor alocis TaxID=143361 RepID=UPI0028E1F6FD|nr:VWA domain-containing protein [Filifactor alocis]